jgi:hypothetical protein
MERKIKNSFKLLSDIVDGLNKIVDYKTHLIQIYVKFYKDEEELTQFSLIKALEVIAEDLYWDEHSNWSEANCVIVHE